MWSGCDLLDGCQFRSACFAGNQMEYEQVEIISYIRDVKMSFL